MFCLFRKIYRIFIIFLIACSLILSNENNAGFSYSAKNKNAFWTKNNNYGLKNSSHISYQKHIHLNQKIDINLDFYFISGNLHISETFLKYRVGKDSYFKIGKYYRDFSSYLNDELSSGSMLISLNAPPMPKASYISKFSPNFNSNIEFKFGISHGQFDQNLNYDDPPFLHEKFLYFNFKLPQNIFKIGLVHEAIWGGTTHLGKQPATFEDYFRIFRASHGSESAILMDQVNALGNHLGIWDFAYIYENKNRMKFYYQHFFEDDSGFKFKNQYDGLWGVEFSNGNSNFLIEHLNTTSRSGNNNSSGNDNYYYHENYLEGWSYKEFVLGNPLIFISDSRPLDITHVGISHKINNFEVAFLLTEKTYFSKTNLFLLKINKYINNRIFGIKIGNDIENNLSLISGIQITF